LDHRRYSEPGRLAAPYHFFAWDKVPGGWETNTRLKPTAILKAMDFYPEKVLIWVDVDCTVRGDLSPLANLRADVGGLRQNQEA
jgi:hypothetical protein